MKYKYLLFDMGNTIIKNIKFDSIKAIEKLYDIINNSHINKESFINDGIKLINNMFINRDINHIEIPYQNYINELLLKYNIKRNDLDFLEIELYKYSVIDKKIDLIKEKLNELKNKNYEMYVLSNATFSSNCLKYTLEQFGILEYFNEVYSSGDVTHRKPSKLFFDECDLEKNIDLDKAIYIGNDEYFDKEFAKNLNIPFVLFKEGIAYLEQNDDEIKNIFTW